ncbi:nucleoporin Nup43-like isoform X1 [Amphiura filiformis]|uniref:nucleoporin Nup43-like isoform X1 n=1 Tax=Amphiura filiformis TaxID=82378 RepID=UPI003B21DDED
MAEPVVKFVSQKISKIRFRPSEQQGLQQSNIFVTGSWDNDENKLSFWRLPPSPLDKGASFHDTLSSVAAGASGPGDILDRLDAEPQLICEERHIGDVTDIKFVNEATLLVSSSSGTVQAYRYNGTQKSLQPTQTWESLHRLRSRECPCTCMSVSGTDVTTCGEDGKINVLRLEHKHPVRTIDNADSCTINALTHLKSHEVVAVNATGQLKIWDLRQPGSEPSRVFLLTGEKVPLHCVDRHPTQPHLVAAGSQGGLLNVWDLRKEKFPVTLFDGHQGHIWEVKFHPGNPDNLFTCSEDGMVLHWDGTGGQTAASAATGVGVGGGFGLGGLPNKPSNADHISPWLSTDPSRPIDTNEVLPANTMPVNSLDVDGDRLVCGTDGEAIFVASNIFCR